MYPSGMKYLHGLMVLSLISIVLLAVGGFMPMQSVHFTAGKLSVATMDTHLAGVVFPEADNTKLFCRALNAGKFMFKGGGSNFCDNMYGGHSFQEIDDVMCTFVTKYMWTDWCDGLNKAATFGIAMIVIIILDILLQLLACWFLYSYMTRKADDTYRSYGLYALVFSSALAIITFAMYSDIVVKRLNSLYGHNTYIPIMSVDKSEPHGVGFIMLWAGASVQAVAIFLYPWITLEEGPGQKGGFYGTFGGGPPPVAAPTQIGPAPMVPAMGPAMGPVLVAGPAPAMGFSAPAAMSTTMVTTVQVSQPGFGV